MYKVRIFDPALPGKTEQLVDNSPRDFSWAYFIAEIQRNSNVCSVMSPAGCSHVNGFKVDNWKQNLRVIYQCFVWSGSAETRKRKVNKIHQSPVVHCIGPSFPMPSRIAPSNTNGRVIRVIYFQQGIWIHVHPYVHASGCIGWPAQTPYALLSWGWTWGSRDAIQLPVFFRWFRRV